MQFTNHEDRERYFERAELHPESVAYGSAMEHAATVRLGVWGNRHELMHDCARILSAELHRYCCEHGHRWATCYLTASTIMDRSQAFRRAFNAARVQVEGQQHNELASAIVEMHGERAAPAWQEQHRTRTTDNEAEALCDLHAKVIDDFERSDLYPITASNYEQAIRH